MSGLMDITGDPGERPTMAGTYVVDCSTGLYATIGTLGALQARERSGTGQVVDVALLDSALSMLMTAIPEQIILGRTMTRCGNRDRYGAPANTFPTRDGAWVHLAVAGEPMFHALAKAMGHADLAGDPRFQNNAARMENVEQLEKFISDWTSKLSAVELLDELQAIGVPSAKVASVSDLVDDDHLAHRGQIIDMDHSRAGKVPMQGFSVQFGDSPMRLRHPPPMLGEQTQAILTEWLDMTPERIARLRERGTI